MNTVVFACIHNAGRSQMAAAWFRLIADPQTAFAVSAGTRPATQVHPEVVEVMREVGIDLAATVPTLLTDQLIRGANLLVTMGCGESCPVVPGLAREDWPLEDPKGKSRDTARRVRDEIRDRVRALVRQRGWGPEVVRRSVAFPLSRAEWIATGAAKRAKEASLGAERIRVVRLMRDYVEPGWCTKAHRLYVARGTLDLHFIEETVRLTAGDIAFLRSGGVDRHRPEPLSDDVELVLFEEEGV